jgi:hypothetical protein
MAKNEGEMHCQSKIEAKCFSAARYMQIDSQTSRSPSRILARSRVAEEPLA